MSKKLEKAKKREGDGEGGEDFFLIVVSRDIRDIGERKRRKKKLIVHCGVCK